MATNAITQMRIRHTQLEMERTNLQVEAKGLCRSITGLLVPELAEIEEMDIARAAAYMDSLVVKQGELLGLQRKLWELERALG
jgi:hypothetical protein